MSYGEEIWPLIYELGVVTKTITGMGNYPSGHELN
jgi:hypothetical protein